MRDLHNPIALFILGGAIGLSVGFCFTTILFLWFGKKTDYYLDSLMHHGDQEHRERERILNL